MNAAFGGDGRLVGAPAAGSSVGGDDRVRELKLELRSVQSQAFDLMTVRTVLARSSFGSDPL
jgi:hypothetical protein